jgi:hypothetical protein
MTCRTTSRRGMSWFRDVLSVGESPLRNLALMGPIMSDELNRGIGACYLLRQVAGSEMLGGLQVSVRPRCDDAGTIRVLATEWRTGADLTGKIEDFAEEAVKGLREIAEKQEITLCQYDVVLSDFLVHDTDSAPVCYFQAGRSAFRSAIEALLRRDLSSGSR